MFVRPFLAAAPHRPDAKAAACCRRLQGRPHRASLSPAPGQLPSGGGPPAGSAAGPSGPGPAYEGGALGLVPVNTGALTPTQQSSFPDDLDPHNVPGEFKKEGSDWFAIFNHKVKRVLDVTLVHTLMHERWVSFACFVRGCGC